LGAQGAAEFVVLLDLGVLVVHVQARGDPVGDDPGPEPAGGGPPSGADQVAVEDEADLSGRPISRLSRMTWSKKIRPETGLPGIWVRENSAWAMTKPLDGHRTFP
ncbi:MAG TPA: hypothetical protein VLW50_06375, partial [Streptosporangiaceae bacterium]|nr:hypothetical protein [Streptosporangiaceae bacterium]